jgi:RNA polymerase sigma-70 factor, ECF subfamily
MMDAQEQQLLRRAQQWDTGALVDIFDTYSPPLYRYALYRTGNVHLAEDCVTETFARFLQVLKRPKLVINTSLRAYLYRTAHNFLIDQARREPAPPADFDEQWLGDSQPGPEQQAEHSERQEVLSQALQQLPAAQQQVIALRYIEEWSLEECAAAMGKTIGAVKSLQYRAIQQLQRIMHPQETEK